MEKRATEKMHGSLWKSKESGRTSAVGDLACLSFGGGHTEKEVSSECPLWALWAIRRSPELHSRVWGRLTDKSASNPDPHRLGTHRKVCQEKDHFKYWQSVKSPPL